MHVARYFIIKVLNKKEHQKIASNNLSDIHFKHFMKLYKDYTKETYSFLVNDTTLPSYNQLHFRKKLLQKMAGAEKIKSINNKIE